MQLRFAIALLASAASWSGCTAPGEGEKAKAGYDNARPVIAALEKYHDRRKEYPGSLRELGPDDLAESARTTAGGKPVSEFFEYEKTATSYRLQFTYTGPGMNRCAYTPEAGKWECAGYH